MEDKWNLIFYENIVSECEDIIAEEAVKWEVEDDINYYYLSTYAKAILTVRESLCLLVNGYPDGALSRAREVYEQMVIAFFISNNDSDKLIERYFADYDLQVYKNRKLQYSILMDEIKSQKEEYQKLKRKCNQKINNLKRKYGDSIYSNDYWWISDTKINSFNQLQNRVRVGRLLILYKRACISTHSSALSDIALLGRDNKKGSLLRTDQTWEGFEAPILLLFGSFDILTQIVFKHFNLNLPDGYNSIKKYKELWEAALA